MAQESVSKGCPKEEALHEKPPVRIKPDNKFEKHGNSNENQISKSCTINPTEIKSIDIFKQKVVIKSIQQKHCWNKEVRTVSWKWKGKLYREYPCKNKLDNFYTVFEGNIFSA